MLYEAKDEIYAIKKEILPTNVDKEEAASHDELYNTAQKPSVSAPDQSEMETAILYGKEDEVFERDN